MMIRLYLLAFLLFIGSFVTAQIDTLVQKDSVKTGWNFGALPTITYDSDLGFQYGGLVNFYYFGDGSRYPNYDHSLYFEWSRFTKGTGIMRFFYDSDQLLKPVRLTADLSYLTSTAGAFYGFNGYESVYNKAYTDDASPQYLSRYFYAIDQSILRAKADFQSDLAGDFGWIAGAVFYQYQIDVPTLNGTSREAPNLFASYRNWGIISEDEASGGKVVYLKGGFTYDTRDRLTNPNKGLWEEIVVQATPYISNGNEFRHVKFTAIHKHYINVIPNRLNFAYRIQYQSTFGTAPYYVQPLIMTSYLTGAFSDGLGGSKSIRGVLRDRAVGADWVFSNFEWRYSFAHFILFKQNFETVASVFLDAGRVLKPITIDYNAVPEDERGKFFSDRDESLHLGAGGGLHIIMNSNFTIAADYGRAIDAQDGSSGIYIGLNFLF